MDYEQEPLEQEQGYVPRPKWQVWGARLGVAFVILLVILYYITIARGGL